MTQSRGIAFVLLAGLSLVLVAPAAGQNQDAARRQAEQFFKQNDKNNDGRLTRGEFPERVRNLFERVDTNTDGAVTLAEDVAYRAARATRRSRPAPPAPDLANVKYGPDQRNVFDLWLANSDRPAPLVIYYHGGGFRGGDKRTIKIDLLKQLLAGGVSVAAVNYRLSGTAPFPAQMNDCARALQFIRLHAAEHNIDPTRVGATGGSAGAGISLWLAFHDDLKDPASADPVKRQSTRLSAAVVYAAQSSYDPRFIKKLFNTDQIDEALIPFFGMKGAAEVDEARFHPLFAEASPINHASSDDVPVMLFYPQANKPLPPNSTGRQHIHHPKFGEVLKEKLDALGVECVVMFREQYPDNEPVRNYVEFFLDKLGLTPDR